VIEIVGSSILNAEAAVLYSMFDYTKVKHILLNFVQLILEKMERSFEHITYI
jgi:hypothetical protein